MRVLVTGATGYIGGRLVPRLREEGHDVRCLVRDRSKLESSPWRDDVEIVVADVLEPGTLPAALEGCDAAFYLIHSMDGGSEDFDQRDQTAAHNFAEAAAGSRLQRIVYLGGLGEGADLSKHLSSRQSVGHILAQGETPVTELRAGVIIGSGSVSFEMLRYLTEVLPVMVTPRWVQTMCQPIAVGDALETLVRALTPADEEDHIHEIGGPGQLSYEQMMQIYAEVAGLPRRRIIRVPVLSPTLSSHWVGLVTPVPPGVAKPLVDSLRNEVIVSDNSFAEDAVHELTPYRLAVAKALQRSEDLEVQTRWSDAASSPAMPYPDDPDWSGGTELKDVQTRLTAASPDDVYWAVTRIGGPTGYYSMDWAWGLRGLLDTLVGGVGLRRGRRHPEQLRTGEALDFWRVVDVEPGRGLKLFAEMKTPGDAWLSFEVEATSEGSELTQTALFRPRGLLGRLYWWTMLPFHLAIFGRMASRIVEAAEQRSHDVAAPPAALGLSDRV
ncbi:MAG: SDR family oxidoreductase [Acidimicrobiia bacterium]